MRVSVARSAFTTAEQTEPFGSLAINVLFHHEILRGIVGPSARLYQCIQCILWFEISCSFVPFVVTENIWLRPTAAPSIQWTHMNIRVHPCPFVVDNQ